MQCHACMNTRRIKSQLLARRTDLLARYAGELQRAAEELESPEIEEVEKATEQWDARVLSLLGAADLAALDRITAALRRLDDGTYGVCTECGIKIEPERLSVLPETPACFDCAVESERSSTPRGHVRAAG